ncbi:unnamed protein product [Arctogadus glacialis]
MLIKLSRRGSNTAFKTQHRDAFPHLVRTSVEGIHDGPPVRALEVGGSSPSMLLIFDVMRGSTQCTHVLYQRTVGETGVARSKNGPNMFLPGGCEASDGERRSVLKSSHFRGARGTGGAGGGGGGRPGERRGCSLTMEMKEKKEKKKAK